MDVRFRGIVATAVLNARNAQRSTQSCSVAAAVAEATPLLADQAELASWIDREAYRQGVSVNEIPSSPSNVRDGELASISRMARESGTFYQGLLRAISQRPK